MSDRVTTTAVRLLTAGEPARVVDGVELPEPGDGEVLVTIDHAGVNPIDSYAAAGIVGDTSRLPRTLGVEGTGLLPDGRRVVVTGVGIGLTRDGTWAGAAVVPAECAIEVPAGVDPPQAGSIGIAAVTAYDVVHRLGRVSAQDRVLVLGAAGGVGVVAVQLAKMAGASVLGQVGSAAKADTVRALGADDVVVASAAELVEAGRAAGWRAPTLVIDPLGGAFTSAAIELAEPGARIVLLGVSAGVEIPFPGRLFYRKGLTLLGYGGLLVTAEQRTTAIRALAQELAAGRLRIPVDEVLPLEKFADAFARLRDRSVIGKVVLRTQP
ncbi:MAG: zinc-binding dehydrogenase [Frankia sp.]|nr:zinc-binding dehydrogenase [Frankia sp.]